ncbi:alpha/beta fold hydrolase [Paucibacter sp. PLA-PC-4]|uniref:alpha/beta fold hydrolase n=1 Tax=Paucibacter sp. PLA-PC-4 TaxID=2993655 RepID=UPI00224B3988|nr:alpha/beta fold hydrolase [Paucibacter sp. PLA-PC-4]MCX2864152.1 alpha/beta fold hydrolase [Paucibacter sp. PLA-PC-4]
MPSKLLFLPGASGNTAFWKPVSELLDLPAVRVFCGWPGFGSTPAEPGVRGIDDLVARVVAEIDRPTALLAQSMGGVIALRAALQRPQLVTHLVLTVTSGGVDLTNLGAEDWRSSFFESNPTVPRWFAEPQPDLAPELSSVLAPTLLLWGDADPISPVAVGRRLAQVLPRSSLHVIAGGSHDLANAKAITVAPLIDQHLRSA